MNWADYFYYDETSPSCLRWAVDVMWGYSLDVVRVSKGEVTGTYSKEHGYYCVGLKRKVYKAHRVVWELVNGKIPPRAKIDHFDGNRSNNSIGNLRLAGTFTNARNVTKQKRREGTHCGVYWRESKPGTWVSVAMWYELDGTQKSKVFSVSRYGLLPAYAKAVAARTAAIARLNKEGADYTERHGR